MVIESHMGVFLCLLHTHSCSHPYNQLEGGGGGERLDWTLNMLNKPRIFTWHYGFFFFLASTSVLGLVFWPSINCTIHFIWIFLSWFCSFPPLFHQVTHQSLCTNSASVCRKPCPPELWSVTMVFVSSSSNAIITLNSYSVKSPSTYPFTFGFKCCCVCGVWGFFFLFFFSKF